MYIKAIEISNLCFVIRMLLTNTVNVGIWSVFSIGPGSAFSKGPLFLKVRFIKYATEWLTLEAYLEPSRKSTNKLLFENSWQLLTVNYFPKKAPSQMFDSVLNTPLNTINIFFWRFPIKVNDFFNFFSTTNFSYQYLPEARVYLETSRTTL